MARQDTRHSVAPLPPVAARIRQAQEETSKTNGEIADGVGVSVRLYLKWKAGAVTPSYPNLARVAEYFDRPVAWFFTTDEAAA